MKKVLLSIVNTNNKELLREALESIFKEKPRKIKLDVVVVDNNSTDGSYEMVKEEFPQVEVIRNTVNLGYPASHNRAIKRFPLYDYVIISNEDIVILDNAIEKLIECMEKHPEVGVCGPELLNSDGSWQPSCQRYITPSRLLMRALYLDKIFPWIAKTGYGLYYPRFYEPAEVDMVMGSFMVVRSEALKKTGIFDERFFIFAEETDLCRRIKLAGWKIMFYPHAKVIHHGGSSTFRRVSTKMFIELHKSTIKFIEKYEGKSRSRVAKHILMLHLILRLLSGWWKPQRTTWRDVLLWHLGFKRQP